MQTVKGYGNHQEVAKICFSADPVQSSTLLCFQVVARGIPAISGGLAIGTFGANPDGPVGPLGPLRYRQGRTDHL